MVSFKRCVFAALILLLIGSFAVAQQTTAKIFGAVTDSDGNPLPGVTVEATSPKLVGMASSITDENGTYRLLNLTPGVYKLVYNLEGFKQLVRENITLLVEQTLTLNVSLSLGSIEESITVTGQAPLIDVKSTSKGMTLTKDVFQTLPKGRNFDGLVAIIPGVVDENFLGGISVDGSSGGENMFYIDGQNTNSMFGGQNAQQASFEFVDEVRIAASGYAAEFGGSLGGVISVVTKSGGNEYHGEVVGYYSGSALRGTERDTVQLDPFTTEPTLQQFNYSTDRNQKIKDNRFELGFGLGGYIIKDKLWFYANALPVLTNNNVPAIFLSTFDPAHQISEPDKNIFNIYNYSSSDYFLNFQGKLSAHPVKNMRLSLSFVNNYSFSNGATPNRNGSSSDLFNYDGFDYGYPNYSYSANLDYTVGNNLMINARLGYFFQGITNKLDPSMANTDQEPRYLFNASNKDLAGLDSSQIRAQGWSNLTTQAMNYPHLKDTESNLSTGADFTYFLNLAGEHAWKAGVSYTRAKVDKNTLWNAPYVIFTAWRETDGRGSVEVRGGPHSRDHADFGKQYGEWGIATSNRWSLYLQDSWTIGNRFTLNFGVRAESENVPSFNDDEEWAEYIGQDVYNFKFADKLSPRVGFSWDVTGDSSLKIYGSYGVYNDVMELDMAVGSFGGMRWISDFYYLDDPTQWQSIGQLQSDGTRDYSMLRYRGSTNYRYQSWGYVDPDLKPMAQSETTLGIEKRLSDDLSLSVRGVYRHLIRTIDDIGVFVPNDTGGFDEVYYIGNPGYGISLPESQGGLMSNDFWPTPKAVRNYSALNISLEKRLSNRWMGGVNLTLSRLYGNYSGIVSADEVNTMGTGFGRPDGNVTRYFDVWWMAYDASGKQQTNSGLMPTDRPIVLKAYGSYVFPFNLTVGFVANYMSGTPKSTEFYVDRCDGYYPEGRGDLGRTPSVFFSNIYAEYNLKLGKNTLQFNVNVDNITNTKTARWYWTRVNWGRETWWDYEARGNQLSADYVNLIKNGYNYLDFEGPYPQSLHNWIRDPRFDKPLQFYPPISARLGIKFIF